MALPEVKVGIFPGAGGTQRVPRLTDAQGALQMLTSGQNLTPKKAKSMGLIHDVVAPDRLIDAAKAMIAAGLKPVQPWDEKGFRLPGGPGLLGRRREPVAGGDRDFAARDLRQLSGSERDPEMRL